MSEWKECKLGDVCCDVSYGYTESASLEQIGPKFLRITDIVPGRVNWATVPYCKISNEDREKYKLQEGDIVIARTGATTGYTYTIKPGDLKYEAVFASYLIRYRVDHRKADPFFVGHLLTSSIWKGFVEGILGGSAQPGANAKQFAYFEIVLPPLPEQRAIASMLSSLDDKIDLLHRQNKTLEGMAEALWRKMFVEEAEPGWKRGKLRDIADNIRESVSVNDLQNHEYYVGLEHLERKHFALYSWGNATAVKSNKTLFSKKDILFGKLRAYFHKVCFAPIDGVCSTDILVIRPNERAVFPFCLLWFSSEDVVNYSDASSGGTRMPRTSWDTLAAYEIAIPPKDIIVEFNRQILPMIRKIEQNVFSIRTLSRLRDTLLPKLMSGEVRVKL